MTDVVIVSAFGRGHWMAWDLVDRGLSVQLIDVSESLGRWTPEDWEGPFGFSKIETLIPSQVDRVSQEDDLDPVHAGWTFWPAEGPLDTRGPLAPHFLEGPLKASLVENNFDQAWPELLARSLSSHVYYDNWEATQTTSRLDWLAPFYVHRVTRRGFQASMDWCRKKGVELFEKATLEDVQVQGTAMNGVEIHSHFKGVLQASQYIWCLSSMETRKLQGKVTEILFPRGVLESEWSWMRYRFACDAGLYQRVIPLHAVVVGDMHFPWTHANLLIVQKTVKAQHFDVWMRLPTHHRFQRAYLEEMGQAAKEVLVRKLPPGEIQILEMPQDYLYEFAELGPSLFPVYSRERLSRFATRNFDNVAFDGPEQWPRLDWDGRFGHQASVVEGLSLWKKRQLEAESKKKGAAS